MLTSETKCRAKKCKAFCFTSLARAIQPKYVYYIGGCWGPVNKLTSTVPMPLKTKHRESLFKLNRLPIYTNNETIFCGENWFQNSYYLLTEHTKLYLKIKENKILLMVTCHLAFLANIDWDHRFIRLRSRFRPNPIFHHDSAYLMCHKVENVINSSKRDVSVILSIQPYCWPTYFCCIEPHLHIIMLVFRSELNLNIILVYSVNTHNFSYDTMQFRYNIMYKVCKTLELCIRLKTRMISLEKKRLMSSAIRHSKFFEAHCRVKI